MPPAGGSPDRPTRSGCLAFLDTFEQFVDRHGHFAPANRAAHFGDLAGVIDEARRFYRAAAHSADR